MTTFEIDLNFQPMTTASEVLNSLCMNSALALETELLESAYCQIFIPVSKKVTVFAEVHMSLDHQPVYYVTSSKNQAATIPALNYRQAVSKLEALLAA